MTINALDIIPVKTASCPVMGDYALKKKMTVPYAKAKKGDIVLFDFNHNGTSDHIGLIYKVADGKIYTVEGNTSEEGSKGSDNNGGMVAKRTRTKSTVNYIVRPKYNDKVTPDMVVATALAQVGTKESPKDSNKVKYNVWFYGKNESAFWCCTFVCWVFAHVQTAEDAKPEPKKETPAGAYPGAFPAKTIKKGSKGADVKNWQKFLQWMGYSLAPDGADGDFGENTEKYTKAAQKKFGFTGKDVDGIVGPMTRKAAKAYRKAAATTASKKEPEKSEAEKKRASVIDSMCEWAKKTAASGKYGYKKWTDKEKTHECPICHPGSGNGWNCIGFCFAVWHHGGKLPSKCNCGVITNGNAEKMLKATDAEALKIAREKIGIKELKVIRNDKKAIPLDKLKKGDILFLFDGETFHHVLFYLGGGKYADDTQHRTPNIKAGQALTEGKKKDIKLAIRYTG